MLEDTGADFLRELPEKKDGLSCAWATVGTCCLAGLVDAPGSQGMLSFGDGGRKHMKQGMWMPSPSHSSGMALNRSTVRHIAHHGTIKGGRWLFQKWGWTGLDDRPKKLRRGGECHPATCPELTVR